MRLTPRMIGDVLETTLGYRILMNPHGFELRAPGSPPRRARLRCGSGIAGRGDVWTLVQLPDGRPITAGITTKARLVRAVLEFMAGPPPPPTPLSDYTLPRARRVVHPGTGDARFVWCRRPKRRPRERVVIVPFGSAQR